MSKQDEIQEEFIKKGLEFFKSNNQGFFNLAMRFGKCRVTIEMMKEWKPKLVIIAYPDNKLRETWLSECEKWGYLQLGPDEKCYTGIDSSPDVYLVNFSSLAKYQKVAPSLFIIDEFHAASPNERDLCHQIMTNSKSTKTLALSGTVSKETKAEWGLKEIASYTTQEGIDLGILADYQITVHMVELDNIVKTPNRRGKMLTEKQKYGALSWVIANKQEKGEPFMMLALTRNRLSLSSIGKMEYVRALLKSLEGKRAIIFTGLTAVADEIGIPSYHNKSASNGNFLAFQAGEIDQLALAAMGKVGVTYTNLDSVILMNFTHNAEESSQILNRAIKLDYKGKIADLHVICLNEPPEIKKIKGSLSMLDKTKIKYI